MKRGLLLLSASAVYLLSASAQGYGAQTIHNDLVPLQASRAFQTESSLQLAQAPNLESVTGAAKSIVDGAAKKMRTGNGRTAPTAKSVTNDAFDSITNHTKRSRKADKAATRSARERNTKAPHSRKAANEAPPPSHSRYRKSTHRDTVSEQRTRNGDYYRQTRGSANCICIEGYYCVGPLGGHYCWTSGGNKRYLKRY